MSVCKNKLPHCHLNVMDLEISNLQMREEIEEIEREIIQISKRSESEFQRLLKEADVILTSNYEKEQNLKLEKNLLLKTLRNYQQKIDYLSIEGSSR